MVVVQIIALYCPGSRRGTYPLRGLRRSKGRGGRVQLVDSHVFGPAGCVLFGSTDQQCAFAVEYRCLSVRSGTRRLHARYPVRRVQMFRQPGGHRLCDRRGTAAFVDRANLRRCPPSRRRDIHCSTSHRPRGLQRRGGYLEFTTHRRSDNRMLFSYELHLHARWHWAELGKVCPMTWITVNWMKNAVGPGMAARLAHTLCNRPYSSPGQNRSGDVGARCALHLHDSQRQTSIVG